METTRLFDVLFYQRDKYPQDVALSGKLNGKWKSYTTQEVIDYAYKVAKGLSDLGIEKGDKVAIISMNRPEWNIIDFGIQFAGAISVPMYPTITAADYNYIFKDSNVKIVFVENEELVEKVNEAKSDVSEIKGVYTFDKIEGENEWKDILQDVNDSDKLAIDELREKTKPFDLATLIYTSGTTGNPKGVMLSHGNIVSNFVSCRPLVPVGHEHNALSFLPLCHVYERMLTYLYMYLGVSIYYAENMETIADNLKEIKPHVFTTVPRLLEKVYEKIYAKGLELKGIKRKLFFWALNLGLKFDLNKNQGFWYNFQLKLANKLIFSKWRDALGGNVIVIVSGSAALQPRLARVFWSAQIPVLEGYGLTETSPVISVNQMNPKYNRIGTVGTLINGVEVKISEENEILSRGPHIMQGYYNKPEETEKLIDQDGWFHTGDTGSFVEEDGVSFLKITGRIKEIFKTSGGKYIHPQKIENKLKESNVVEQIMVVGEFQKFPAALIVPSFDNLREWCKIKNIAYSSNIEMIEHPEVLKKYNREIDKLNDNFAQYERIKKFKLLSKEWTIDDGELTPTLKCKRKNISEKYKSFIDEIYEEQVAI